MNIKVHIALVLAACTITGFGLGLGLVLGYRSVEMQINEVGPNSVAVANVQNLRQEIGSWLMSVDLVLNGGETYVLNDAESRSRQILDLIRQIGAAPLARDKGGELARVEYDVLEIQELVDSVRGTDPSAMLSRNRLVAEKNRISKSLVYRVQELQERMVLSSEYLTHDLEVQRAELKKLSWVAAVAYAVVIGVAWFWTVRTMVTPIEQLSLAAERAHLGEGSFRLQEFGPDEVRRLTRNMSVFVRQLRTANERTEHEVEERTAQLVKANKAKGDFLATMSHELRTPLNGIINMNELILETQLDGEQREFAQTSRDAAEALLALINDILDFSKIEARKLELEHLPFQPREIVDGALEIVHGVAEAKGIELAAVVAHDVPGTVLGDPTRLRQVLLNLLNNALKFTEQGFVVVRVSTFEETPGEVKMLFQVVDTGIGIPEERRTRLFRAFEQVDSSTTRKYGGTGLGLAICRELSQLMGGEIGVDSEVGEGSTFWFTSLVARGRREEDQGSLPDTGKRRAYVVSMRPLVCERLREHLLFLGLSEDSVHTVDGGSDSLTDVASGCGENPEKSLVIVDPYGFAEEEAGRIVDSLRPLIGKGVRTAVMEHVLRKREMSTRLTAEGVSSLHDPVRIRDLRDWILDIRRTDINARIAAANKERKRTGRILVAEDNPINQRVASRILERAGYEVALVDDGQAALNYLLEKPCDLVLMDCQMPVMNGWQASRAIRDREQGLGLAEGNPPHMPIVALTANALEGERERCIVAGMDDFMSKPFKPKRLLEMLDQYLVGGEAAAEE